MAKIISQTLKAAGYTLRTTSLTGKLLVASLNKNKAVHPPQVHTPKHGLPIPAVPAPHTLRKAPNKPNRTASRPGKPQSLTHRTSVGNILH